MIYFYLTITGIAAGILGAILGLGGGIIMLPAIQLLLGFDPIMAVGTSLFAVIFTSFSGALGHFRGGNVRLKSALLVGGGGLLGMLVGSHIFKHYLSGSVETLKLIMGLLFLFMAVKMGRESYQEWKANLGVDKEALNAAENEHFTENVSGMMGLGMFTGILSGMLGVGGGFIMVPGMMWFFNAGPRLAVGTTLTAMLPIALMGGLIKLFQGFVIMPDAVVLGLGTVIGAQIGVRISGKISAAALKFLFTILFIFLTFTYL